MSKSRILLESMQVKSLNKAKRLAHALSIIEEECGIKEVKIEVKDFFFCPDIDTSKLSKTEMEKLIAQLFKK